ncbi:magnesium and cobalt transport protein CorA [Planctomonas psychrotolerans]|uniref:magnesium and cobalt transport protein CorA n=1 Tax=Planctomonas psychrotolerans TaxID=2528712 RepID=UPI00123B1736|nr:magnesium and cobalt transport protein CorA [Planctomonas psychrotolerans]
MIVDNAVYVDGYRTKNPANLQETFELLRERAGMAWIGLYRPDAAEIRAVADEFGLHALAVEDASKGHQRSKLERYSDTLFLVLRPARYLDSEEKVEFGELHVFVGPAFVVTIRRAESPDLAVVRHRLEAAPDLLGRGSLAVLYAILDQVVDEYGPVVAGLENDIDEIEDQLFSGSDADVSRRIYALLSEVINFRRAVHPLIPMLETLVRGAGGTDAADAAVAPDVELERLLRDVLDHVLRVSDSADSFHALLQNALTVHSTLVTQRQNDEMRRLSEAGLDQNEQTRRLSETTLQQSEQMKKVSSWAAILFAPTLIGTVYGMNFDTMPELHWTYGYPLAVGAMVAMGAALYTIFKAKKWL